MSYKLILLFTLLFCISCKECKKEQIEHIVKEWNNKKILFPEKAIFTRFVDDTVSYNIPEVDYKVVVFVDSIGCISCKLQLPKWKEFINEVNSLCEKNVSFMFFFQSKNIKELRYIFKHNNFSFPVCIDTNDCFNSLNHFPEDMMFQTFLVDKDNYVKVIGNPIHNLSVKDLYLSELTGKKTSSLSLTTIQTNAKEYNMGTLKKGEEKRQIVTIHNIGKENFRIEGVTTSCDCMAVEYDWKEVGSGESAIITVIYKAEDTGDFWRTITIYGNILGQSITLEFMGNVK